jgi:hypothetical protein
MNYLGYDYVVTDNGLGYRCGYVKIPVGHPWYRQKPSVDVHRGITFAEADDSLWWIGFDCSHKGDDLDPSLPITDVLSSEEDLNINIYNLLSNDYPSPGGHVWTQEEVEEECRKLIRQAVAVIS